METLAFPFEVKALTDAGTVEGLAAGYGNVDKGGDVVAPGAFAASIAEHKSAGRAVPMLLYHDPARPVGKWDSFTETAQGLYAKGALSLKTADARDAHALLKDGALTGLSVGYKTKAATPYAGGGRRRIDTADLWEVSLVTFPMNDRSRITSVKSIDGARHIEELLRGFGLSPREAKAGASAAWRAITDQDDEPAATETLAELLRKSSAEIARFHGEIAQ